MFVLLESHPTPSLPAILSPRCFIVTQIAHFTVSIEYQQVEPTVVDVQQDQDRQNWRDIIALLSQLISIKYKVQRSANNSGVRFPDLGPRGRFASSDG